jgi:hypothetical protein
LAIYQERNIFVLRRAVWRVEYLTPVGVADIFTPEGPPVVNVTEALACVLLS